MVQELATLERARGILREIGLDESSQEVQRPVSGHRSSTLVPCEGQGGKAYLLKVAEPPVLGQFYPPEISFVDFARREAAFYRFLDTFDNDRRELPAPRSVLIDAKDPPKWILLERLAGAIGPAEEVLSASHVLELLVKLQSVPIEKLVGRRDFPLNRWDTISFVDRMRMMYDPLLFVLGERRWESSLPFFHEALRWTETRPQVLVHGDFTEQNLLVDIEGNPYLVDFERVGIGSPDHDFAWFWIHSRRSTDWKCDLLRRWLGKYQGSDRIRSQWSIRASVVFMAARKLRFDYMTLGGEAPELSAGLALFDAALCGGPDFFPF
jgi:aminoglycoside phosphotransferase (APT) family kinase protein